MSGDADQVETFTSHIDSFLVGIGQSISLFTASLLFKAFIVKHTVNKPSISKFFEIVVVVSLIFCSIAIILTILIPFQSRIKHHVAHYHEDGGDDSYTGLSLTSEDFMMWALTLTGWIFTTVLILFAIYAIYSIVNEKN